MPAIKKLLIANRGEIARRVIRTAQRMGIATVAVYSDADAQALHVREASCAVALGGNTSAESYLRIDKLIAAARTAGADAVHPGYGFLSENAEFAQAVVDAGLTWVGPPAAAIQALGNKSRAKELALSRGVPCLPGYNGSEDAHGQSDERFAREAQRIGYPLMVKATAGGGGRGMRLVLEESTLMAALHSARSEALSSFGSDELLLERALIEPRHVEIQIFADQHGNCVHMGERDCSVQRRHQKIIEESPSPAVDALLRERMGRCAVELALAAGYVGAGTVEFLLDESAGEKDKPSFYLMEMNTRLQVEHPVTEAVTGLDLVEWQLRVAQGEVLPLMQDQITFTGHAIEVRLCAEDEQYTPHAGTIGRFMEPMVNVRFDHAIYSGMQVAPYYDSMLGKLIVHAPTRQQSINHMVTALTQTQLLGLPSNRQFLMAILQHTDFQAGHARIPFLTHEAAGLRIRLKEHEQHHLMHAAMSLYRSDTCDSEQTLPCPFTKSLRLRHRDETYQLNLQEQGSGQAALSVDEKNHAATCTAGICGNSSITIDQRTEPVCAIQLTDTTWHVQVGGTDLWLDDLTFAPPADSSINASSFEVRGKFNGKVIAIQAKPGDTVARGDTLMVIESMKLEHAIPASQDGVIAAVEVALGQQTATGQLLVRFQL